MVCERHPDYLLIFERDVLILVLMEYGLRVELVFRVNDCLLGLNPCFNGIWSARVKSVKICV